MCVCVCVCSKIILVNVVCLFVYRSIYVCFPCVLCLFVSYVCLYVYLYVCEHMHDGVCCVSMYGLL